MSIYSYFAEYTNCPIRDSNCLRNKTSEEILKAQLLTNTKLTSLKLLLFFEPWLPYLDGKLIQGQLLQFDRWNLPKNFTFKPV